MSAEYNFNFDWNRISTLGKVKVMVEQVVGAPSQEAINTAVADYIEAHPGSLSPLSPAVKSALLQIAEKVAYIDEHGEDYYDALDAALSAKTLLQITAVYTQTGAVYERDTLDSLKSDLVVTAYYDDSTTVNVTSLCTLSGTLEVGTSTVTATYQELTSTFTVTVSQGLPSEYTQYDYIQSKANSGQISTPYGGYIKTAAYADLNALSIEFDYEALSGHYTGACIFGRRTANGSATSYAFYAGNGTLGYHLHGNDTNPSMTAANDSRHHVKYTNTAESPSTLQVDNGEPTSIVWSNTNKIENVAFTLLTNAYAASGNFNMTYKIRVGRIKLFDLSNTLVGDYFPCVRVADDVVGIYDMVTSTFHTATSVSYATIGNGNQRYIVGNWE